MTKKYRARTEIVSFMQEKNPIKNKIKPSGDTVTDWEAHRSPSFCCRNNYQAQQAVYERRVYLHTKQVDALPF